MDASSAILASIPPAFSVLLEYFNPISGRLVRANAEKDFKQFEAGVNQSHLFDSATKFGNGAVEVAGLAPTLVAALTSGFGALKEFPNPFWPSAVYVLLVAALTIVVVTFVAGQTFVELDDTRQPFKFFGQRTMKWTGTETIAKVIYFTNLFLLAFVWISFAAL